VLDGIEAQVLDVTRHAGLLLASGVHVSAALDQLLDTRNQLTRVLLGAQREAGAGATT
jgi:hypothetical protein